MLTIKSCETFQIFLRILEKTMEKRNKLFLTAIFVILAICCTGVYALNFSNVSFSGYQKKAFTPKNASGTYYDNFNIYYKSYNYSGSECITDFYLVGSKGGKEEVILYSTLENRNAMLQIIRYGSNGREISYSSIAGYLHNDAKSQYENTNLEVFGFSNEIFNDPFCPEFLFLYDGDSGPLMSDSIRRLEYNYAKNALTEWNPN
jgi:hypothetical protein